MCNKNLPLDIGLISVCVLREVKEKNSLKFLNLNFVINII